MSIGGHGYISNVPTHTKTDPVINTLSGGIYFSPISVSLIWQSSLGVTGSISAIRESSFYSAPNLDTVNAKEYPEFYSSGSFLRDQTTKKGFSPSFLVMAGPLYKHTYSDTKTSVTGSIQIGLHTIDIRDTEFYLKEKNTHTIVHHSYTKEDSEVSYLLLADLLYGIEWKKNIEFTLGCSYSVTFLDLTILDTERNLVTETNTVTRYHYDKPIHSLILKVGMSIEIAHLLP
ncbi:MAG: hypothetical protein OCD01_04105 [Fibrobacterales bacterium]